MALPPGSQHQSCTNSLPQGGLLLPPDLQTGLSDLHEPLSDLQADQHHLQTPSPNIRETHICIQSEEEDTKNKDQQGTNSNKKVTNLQLPVDVRLDTGPFNAYCVKKEIPKHNTLEPETSKNIDFEKNNESRCGLDIVNEKNVDSFNNKDVLENISRKSTNSNKSTDSEHKNYVKSDKNNNLKKKNSNTSITSISSNTSVISNTSLTINNRKISDVVILLNNEECNGKELDSTNKKKLIAHYPKYNKQRLIPPLNKASSSPTLKVSTPTDKVPNVHFLKIAPPLNKVASAPELRVSPNFTDYKNSYLQRNTISELTLKTESPRESINIKKQAKAKKISLEKIKMVNSDICIFCGEGSQLEGTGLGQLITFCHCRVSAHNDCLTSYITFPSSSHDRCCVCRGKLQYAVIDKDTPIHIKYAIMLVLIVMAYLGLILLSIHFTQELIPMGDIHEFLYLLIIGNLGFIPPAIVVFIITCLLNFRRPQPKLGESNENSLIPQGGFSTWFGCSSEDCEEKNCGGDTCGFILAAFCLLSVMVVLISSSIYIFYNVYLYYKSFKLKSKKSIRFSCDRNNKNVYKV